MTLFNRRKSANHMVWNLLGGAALGVAAIALVANLSDIKRYIKISMM